MSMASLRSMIRSSMSTAASLPGMIGSMSASSLPGMTMKQLREASNSRVFFIVSVALLATAAALLVSSYAVAIVKRRRAAAGLKQQPQHGSVAAEGTARSGRGTSDDHRGRGEPSAAAAMDDTATSSSAAMDDTATSSSAASSGNPSCSSRSRTTSATVEAAESSSISDDDDDDDDFDEECSSDKGMSMETESMMAGGSSGSPSFSDWCSLHGVES